MPVFSWSWHVEFLQTICRTPITTLSGIVNVCWFILFQILLKIKYLTKDSTNGRQNSKIVPHI